MQGHHDADDFAATVDQRVPPGQDFGELVRDALKNLHDLAYLRTHPLIAFIPAEPGAASIHVGRLLAQHLSDAIGALHNEHAPPARLETERRYRLLSLRYLEGRAPPRVQQELAISRSTYQREHAAALAVLTSLLAERWRLIDRGDARPGQPSVTSRDRSGSHSEPGEGSLTVGAVPSPLTSFIGRAHELETVVRLLGSERLVTLTGPPGIGKTRLAIEVATRLKPNFDGEICFVSLASIRDTGLVVSTIARARGVRELPGRALLEALADDLRDRHVLIVLDNFEQLLPSASTVANLLASAPRLRALVTSRAPLHVRGESVFQVPALALPPLASAEHATTSATSISDYAAVQLFVERAQAANTSFVLTAENAADVIEICRRVDGLPLAIELAAARSRILSPPAIRTRLEHRLSLLTSGQRDLPERQQALRTAIDWSYDLLDDDAKLLFRRTAVFAGGCDLPAVEAVCTGPDRAVVDVLGGVTSLVDHSLLVRENQPGGEPRFRMLESIREYALERLAESHEDDHLWQRYATYYCALGAQATSSLLAPQQMALLQRLDVEHDNLRTALRWLADRGEASASLELAGALAWYWLNRNLWAEGRRWLNRVLTIPGTADSSLSRARALLGAGILAVTQGDFTAARELLIESTTIFREHGEKLGLALGLGAMASLSVRNRERAARALVVETLALFRELGAHSRAASMLLQLGSVLIYEGDHVAAQDAFLTGLALWQEIGDRAWVADAIGRLGHLATVQGDYSLARARFQESLAMYRSLSGREGIAKQGMAVVLNRLGELAQCEGNLAQATALHEEALQLASDLGDIDIIALAVQDLGRVRRQSGDPNGALTYFRESLLLRQQQGHTWGVLVTMCEIARAALERGDPRRAVRLYALAERLHRTSDLLSATGDPGGYDQIDIDRHLSAAKTVLGPESFAEQWALGADVTLTRAVDDALQAWPTPRT